MANTDNKAEKAHAGPKVETTGDRVVAAREAVEKAVVDARTQVSDTARRTLEAIEANPLPAVVGGLALGVIAGALLPRIGREEELLRPIGSKLASTTKHAIEAAKDSGKQELGALGLTRDSASQQGGAVAQNVLRAVIAASTAALAANKVKNTGGEGSQA